MTQKELYNNANELFNQGNLIDALELFLQIPDHPNSFNMIKQIYAKYTGYYWDEAQNMSLHLTVSGSKKVDVEIRYNIDGLIIKITESGQIDKNKIKLVFNFFY